MDERKAREILKYFDITDYGLFSSSPFFAWNKKNKDACLDGDFTADDLEAIAWWMRNKTATATSEPTPEAQSG